MQSLATHFATILSGLRDIIAASAARKEPDPALVARNQARTALLVRLWSYVGRTAARFERLVARWQAGTLPTPRPPRPGRPAPRAARPRLPTARAWVVHALGYQAANKAGGLAHLLARPDLAELLAAAPQAARLLRPLCRMLGVTPPLTPGAARPAIRTPTTPSPAAPPPGPSAPQGPAPHRHALAPPGHPFPA